MRVGFYLKRTQGKNWQGDESAVLGCAGTDVPWEAEAEFNLSFSCHRPFSPQELLAQRAAGLWCSVQAFREPQSFCGGASQQLGVRSFNTQVQKKY